MRAPQNPFLLIFALVVGATLSARADANEGEAGGQEYAIQARAQRPARAPAAGGEFALAADTVERRVPHDQDLAAEPSCVRGAAKLGSSECGCFCSNSIFTDGFESGNTSAWSSTLP